MASAEPATEPAAQAFAPVVAAVQRNCHVSDARHAQDLSLCTYLLAMREYFRWERDLPLAATPDRAEVGRWIAAREALWRDLGGGAGEFVSLPLAGGVDPFDEGPVNRRLGELGLYYGAGIGRFGAPTFFVAELERVESRDGIEVIVTGRELARGLNTPLAVSRGDTVVVRCDALRRWLFTKAEGWRLRPRDDAFSAAFAAYEHGGDLSDTVERIAGAEAETLVLHELGEVRAASLLGPAWEDMLATLTSRRAELFARAVRDLLADCAVTLPTLLERDARASIHFWFATFEGLRRELAPELAAGYDAWRGGDAAPLQRAVDDGTTRWQSRAEEVLARHRAGGEAAVEALLATA